jgi:hypothetical protein
MWTIPLAANVGIEWVPINRAEVRQGLTRRAAILFVVRRQHNAPTRGVESHILPGQFTANVREGWHAFSQPACLSQSLFMSAGVGGASANMCGNNVDLGASRY